MIANTEITLITLLEHKQILFALIDQADSSGVKGAREFSVSVYYYLVNKALQAQTDTERRRLSAILSLENLDRRELLSYWDKTADIFIFQPFVIAMFRHLESHRLQELSDAELNGLHARLKEIYNDVRRTDFLWFREDIEYKERFGHIITTLRDINSRIDQNVASLKGQAKTLAELADKEVGENTFRTEQVHQTLKRIFDLVERYIRPTLRFLNPDLDWKGEANSPPLYFFSQIMQRFDNRGFTEERTMMSRIYWNLLHASEEITIVRKSLDVYIHLYEHQRRLYNVIEEKYNTFYNQVKELQDGKLRGNKLDPNRALMSEMAVIQGLKYHISAQSALISFPKSLGIFHLEEHLRVRLNRIHDQKCNIMDANRHSQKNDQEDIKNRKRFKKLCIAAQALTFEQRKDLYFQIHTSLSKTLDDYTLVDVIDAYGIAVLNRQLVVNIDLSSQVTITYGGRTLTYFPRNWIGEILKYDKTGQ